ncbi:MAG: hypothetical protein H6818_22560 [Phycisphaerales bacterium]|nr:hypothetical protein [Phycisphaerales bacterium]
MSDEKFGIKKDEHAETGTLDLLKQIQSGQMNPKAMGRESRRQVVAALVLDGYATPEIAKILHTSDRTIERDRQALRESTVLHNSPELVSQVAGRLFMEIDTAIQRIRRAIRGKDVTAAVKVDAEHRCCQIYSDYVQRLQGLGYLPTAKQQIEADMVHHMGTVPSFRELENESRRLLELTMEAGGADGAESVKQFKAITDEIQRGRIAEELREIEKHAAPLVEHEGAGAMGETPDD